MDLLIFIFGVVALAKGKFKLTKNLVLESDDARKLGALAVTGILLNYFLLDIPLFAWGWLVVIVILGSRMAKTEVEAEAAVEE